MMLHSHTCCTGVTGSVDSRQLAASTGSGGGGTKSLPAYLSVIATIKTTQLGVSDRALTERCSYKTIPTVL